MSDAKVFKRILTPGDPSYKIKWIEAALVLYVDTGYYTFSKPFRWNYTTGQMNFITSKWHTIVRIICTTLTTLSTTAQFVSLIRDAFTGNLPLTEFHSFWRLVMLLMCSFTSFFQVHTAIRPYEVIEFTNLAKGYLNLMIKHQILDSPKKFDKLCGVLLFGGWLGLGGTALSLLMFYLLNCESHFLSSVLPICEQSLLDDGKIRNDHGSTENTIFYFLLLAFIILQLLSASLCYLAMLIVPVLGCTKVLSKMSDSSKSTKKANQFLQRNEIWLLHYRCLQMLFRRMNISMGKYIVPFTLLIFTILLVIINYVFIAVPFQTTMLTLLLMYTGIIIVFLTIIREGIFFLEISIQIVNEIRAKCTRIDYFTLQLGTCFPLQVECGGFFHLTRLTLMQILDVVLEYTVDLLLSF